MEAFPVTRSRLQQIAETGATQLTGGPDLPSADDFAEEEITRALESGVMSPDEFDEDDIKKRAIRVAATRAMNAATPLILATAEEIYRMSLGDLPVERIREVSIKKQTSANHPFTVLKPGDANVLNCHRDNTNRLYGFSILWSLLRIPGEELIVAGRGSRPSKDYLARYKYSRGPIVIAQKNFGSLLVGEEAARNAAWHRAQRSRLGIVATCDASYDELTVVEDARLLLKFRNGTMPV